MDAPARPAVGRGILAMVTACVVWGLSALCYRQIAHVPPLEVLSHRTIWSLMFLLVFLALRGQLGTLGALLRDRSALAVVAMASITISCNWFIFIFSVQIGRVMETSLGYYIFPLVAVALGFLVLGQRLTRWQSGAVALAVLAVAILTAGLGVVPWISLGLAFSFGLYGVIKARLKARAVITVAAEVVLLSPLALIWLWGVHSQGWVGPTGRAGGFFFGDVSDTFWLVASGLVTCVPLVLMAYALQQLRLATVGLIQYLNPTIQFVLAASLFGEPFTPYHAVAFPLIWLGLAVYSWDSIRQDMLSRRALIRA